MLKNKEYDKLRKWVCANIDLDSQIIMRKLYDISDTFINKKSIPSLVLLIGEYQKSIGFVADKELHLLAFFTEVMMNCEFL